ncbi:MAG: A/G-specific adenine glycosylase [Chloroflexi bacterium]|nr:A/G-specific adenine glycosylase [Chloroflexota bacterium]
MANLARVQSALLNWFRREGRDLPWRTTRDPYAILVAEVMLQQTQVDRVIPRYHAWLGRFPTLDALASASPADAIRAWQGLGYNRRAVRLHAIARQSVAEFDGQLPRSVEGLLRLDGVGRYTAGAVACFAYEQPVPMVDTNVRRVLSRVFGVEPKRVEAMAVDVIPEGQAWAWGQALMDLGAGVCRAHQPLCLICPLLQECGGPLPGERRRAAEGKFESSNRYVRGRILDELRALPPGSCLALTELAARVDGRADLIQALAGDGLVQIDAGAGVRLPE